MYSTILTDSRLRDLVNGHTPSASQLQYQHSDATWSGGLFDGTLGLNGVPVRGSVGGLGAGVLEGAGYAAAVGTAADAAQAESLDIRRILSKPLPPRPSDVDLVRSSASFDVSGAKQTPHLLS